MKFSQWFTIWPCLALCFCSSMSNEVPPAALRASLFFGTDFNKGTINLANHYISLHERLGSGFISKNGIQLDDQNSIWNVCSFEDVNIVEVDGTYEMDVHVVEHHNFHRNNLVHTWKYPVLLPDNFNPCFEVVKLADSERPTLYVAVFDPESCKSKEMEPIIRDTLAHEWKTADKDVGEILQRMELKFAWESAAESSDPKSYQYIGVVTTDTKIYQIHNDVVLVYGVAPSGSELLLTMTPPNPTVDQPLVVRIPENVKSVFRTYDYLEIATFEPSRLGLATHGRSHDPNELLAACWRDEKPKALTMIRDLFLPRTRGQRILQSRFNSDHNSVWEFVQTIQSDLSWESVGKAIQEYTFLTDFSCSLKPGSFKLMSGESRLYQKGMMVKADDKNIIKLRERHLFSSSSAESSEMEGESNFIVDLSRSGKTGRLYTKSDTDEYCFIAAAPVSELWMNRETAFEVEFTVGGVLPLSPKAGQYYNWDSGATLSINKLYVYRKGVHLQEYENSIGEVVTLKLQPNDVVGIELVASGGEKRYARGIVTDTGELELRRGPFFQISRAIDDENAEEYALAVQVWGISVLNAQDEYANVLIRNAEFDTVRTLDYAVSSSVVGQGLEFGPEKGVSPNSVYVEFNTQETGHTLLVDLALDAGNEISGHLMPLLHLKRDGDQFKAVSISGLRRNGQYTVQIGSRKLDQMSPSTSKAAKHNEVAFDGVEVKAGDMVTIKKDDLILAICSIPRLNYKDDSATIVVTATYRLRLKGSTSLNPITIKLFDSDDFDSENLETPFAEVDIQVPSLPLDLDVIKDLLREQRTLEDDDEVYFKQEEMYQIMRDWTGQEGLVLELVRNVVRGHIVPSDERSSDEDLSAMWIALIISGWCCVLIALLICLWVWLRSKNQETESRLVSTDIHTAVSALISEIAESCNSVPPDTENGVDEEKGNVVEKEGDEVRWAASCEPAGSGFVLADIELSGAPTSGQKTGRLSSSAAASSHSRISEITTSDSSGPPDSGNGVDEEEGNVVEKEGDEARWAASCEPAGSGFVLAERVLPVKADIEFSGAPTSGQRSGLTISAIASSHILIHQITVSANSAAADSRNGVDEEEGNVVEKGRDEVRWTASCEPAGSGFVLAERALPVKADIEFSGAPTSGQRSGMLSSSADASSTDISDSDMHTALGAGRRPDNHGGANIHGSDADRAAETTLLNRPQIG